MTLRSSLKNNEITLTFRSIIFTERSRCSPVSYEALCIHNDLNYPAYLSHSIGLDLRSESLKTAAIDEALGSRKSAAFTRRKTKGEADALTAGGTETS